MIPREGHFRRLNVCLEEEDVEGGIEQGQEEVRRGMC